MNVGQLIEYLQQFHPSVEVVKHIPKMGYDPEFFSTEIEFIEGFAVHNEDIFDESKPDPYSCLFVDVKQARSKDTTDGKQLLDLSSPYIKPAILMVKKNRPFKDWQDLAIKNNE